MKLNKLCALLLGGLALTACSKDELSPLPSAGSDAPKTISVPIKLEVGHNLDDSTDAEGKLRSTYVAEASGKAYRLQMPERDLMVYVVVTRDNATPVGQTLKFTKVKGVNRSVFYGNLTLPQDGTGRYRAVATVLSEVGNPRVFAKVSTDNPLQVEVVQNVSPTGGVIMDEVGDDNLVETSVPYSTDWFILPELEDNKFKVVSYPVFYPLGTLLRIRFKNEIEAETTISGASFSTSAFVTQGHFDLTPKTSGLPAFVSKQKPEIYPLLPETATTKDGLYFATGSGTTEQNITLAAKGTEGATSKWYYVWVMPTSKTTATTHIGASLLEYNRLKLKYTFGGLVINTTLPSGHVALMIPVTPHSLSHAHEDIIDWDGDWSTGIVTPSTIYPPLTMFTEYNLAPNGTSFATSNRSDASGYFTYEYANQNLRSINIGGKTYYLPRWDDWTAVFPYLFSETSFEKASHDNLNVYEYFRGIGYRAHYWSRSGTIYAVRFINTSKKIRSAYRYRLVNRGVGNEEAYIEVQARLLPENTSTDTNALRALVAVESYWTPGTPGLVTRQFPLAGENMTGNGSASRQGVGTNALYYGYSLSGYADVRTVGLDQHPRLGLRVTIEGVGTKLTYRYGYPIRLVKAQSDITAN